jgi:choline-glycine betaine transporter
MKNFLKSSYEILFPIGMKKAGIALLLTLILISLSSIDGLDWLNELSYVPFVYVLLVLVVSTFILLSAKIKKHKNKPAKKCKCGGNCDCK